MARFGLGTRLRVLGAVAVVLVASSCNFAQLAHVARENGWERPWWCTATEEIPVTDGPAAGTVDWYAGTHKGDLAWDDCEAMSAQFDVAKAYALQWPTRGQAEADGWKEMTSYISGMGTHHLRGGITPAMLASPTFDRQNPILDGVGLDDVFDPAHPEVLQFDGAGANAQLVGFDYYVRTSTGLPPEGFPGNNDWWHHHPWICFRNSDAAMIGFNQSDSWCTTRSGTNVNLSNYYMLHVWVLDDMIFEPDVFAGMMPCISGGTAIHDAADPCHKSRSGGTSAGMDHTVIDPDADPAAADHSGMDHGG
ncbi:MAG: hypothetical protein KF703_14125 [Actinobacteria bacterium]|nr:hypothetical protein [Actinomycetota bacterium]